MYLSYHDLSLIMVGLLLPCNPEIKAILFYGIYLWMTVKIYVKYLNLVYVY